MACAIRRAGPRTSTYIVAAVLLGVVGTTMPSGAAPGNGVVRGKVVGGEKLLPQVYVDASKNDSRKYTWREASPTVKTEFRKLSANVSRDVCVVALSASGQGHEHEPMYIKVTGGRITPSTLVLAPGSRLSFKNADPFPHNLYEQGNDKWASNPLAPGSTREWAATTPGLHVIRDELFPSVVMYIQVDPAAVDFAMPDHDGAFAFNLPAGDYTLKTFFDGKPVGKEAAIHVAGGIVDMREPLVLGGEAK